MSKRNIIIITLTIIVTISFVCFFLRQPREQAETQKTNQITAETPKEAVEAKPLKKKPSSTKIAIQEIQEEEKEVTTISVSESNITASEYANFERAIDTLMEMTWTQEEEN